MNAHSHTWVQIGRLEQIPRQGARCVTVGSLRIGIFRTVDDEIYALEDKCPHKQGPLSQGIVHDNCVTCPLHNWVISLTSGEAQGADEGGTRTFRVRLEDGAIQLDLGSIT